VSSPTAYGNPYLQTPAAVAAGQYVSGGGGDGTVDHVVALVWQRINRAPGIPGVSAILPDPGVRGFDLAELIAWAAAAAGVVPALPPRTDLLRAACWGARTRLRSVAAGLGLKGALLFGPGGLGLAVGVRARVVVYDPAAGIVLDVHATRTWDEAATIPGARGYR